MDEPAALPAYRAAAQVLGLGRTLARISRVGATLGVAMAWPHPSLLYGQFLLWALAEWAAARVALDAILFEKASQGTELLPALDEMLGRKGRPVASRVCGAMRWLRIQGGATGLVSAYALALLGCTWGGLV